MSVAGLRHAGQEQPIGRKILRQIAQTLRDRVSDTQVLARYTSDTFTVLLPGINRDHAVTIAENLRIGVAMQLYMAAEQVEQVTVSIGAATYPDDATSVQELLQAGRFLLVFAIGWLLLLRRGAG